MTNEVFKKVDKYLLIFNKPLGQGSYGKVYKAKLENNQESIFAVKVINKKRINHDQYLINALFNQIYIMNKLKSQYIVSLIQVLSTNNNYYIVQQYCDSGDLRKFINQNKNGIDQTLALKIIGDIMQGYIHLIKNGIIHRDLKPQNILSHKNKFKIADFGFSKHLTNFNNQMLNSQVGTPLYMSPQLLRNYQYTSKSDIWSIGLIFYELLYGKTPWIANQNVQLIKKIQNDKLQFGKKRQVSNQAKQLIRGCLRKQQKNRLSFLELFKNKLFEGRFTQFLNKSKSLEDKAAYIINHLRSKIQENNIDLFNLFKLYDYTNDSKLNKKQFYKLLLTIDIKIKKDQVIYIFDKVDNDGNGLIQFQEFKAWLQQNQINNKSHQPNLIEMSPQQKKAQQAITKFKVAIEKSKKDLRTIFNSFDKDNSQQLDFNEFEKLLHIIEPILTQQQIHIAFNKFDVNKDQLITFQEFKNLLIKISGKGNIYDPQFEMRLKQFQNNCN